jgi:hypothetical protein
MTRRRRCRCDVDPDKVSALQSNDDEDIEQVEANGRGNEQVHGGDVRRMVTQEGAHLSLETLTAPYCSVDHRRVCVVLVTRKNS